ncbi:MAG: SIR2 family protein [Pseudonocardiaceae bacterium]
MQDHLVANFAAGLSAKLAARSRHVCIFLGAGAARACGLPDIEELQTKVLEGLQENQRAAFSHQLDGHNLEHALSRLRRVTALLGGTSDKVDGLNAQDARDLDSAVCQQIVKALDVAEADLEPMLRLAEWAAHADYHLPVELFTVNYDLLLETAMEARGIAYFDGFVGALRARFRAELVEAAPADTNGWLPRFLVRLWKLHGSVHWAWESDARAEVVRLGTPVIDGAPAAIYPSDAKYDESRRVPFVVLQDRFRRALHHSETLVLISGYSFTDEHLNEMMFDAARRRPRSELIAFCFDKIPHSLTERAAVTPNLQVVAGTEAILGGVRADWKVPEDVPADLWVDGAFGLGNFANLSRFLARSSSPLGEPEASLVSLGEPHAKAAENICDCARSYLHRTRATGPRWTSHRRA